MGRVLGFVLIVVVLIAIVWFLLKHKKKRTDCEKAGDLAAGALADGDKINDQKISSFACNVLGEVVKRVEKGLTAGAGAIAGATSITSHLPGFGSHYDYDCAQLKANCANTALDKALGGAARRRIMCQQATAKGCK